MQVLWREALEGNCPLTVDEFLYCYKPSEIKKSAGFYQFSSRGSHYSLITGRSSSDRLWKQEFFIISGDWAGDPTEVSNAPFPPFTSPIGRLRPEGMFSFYVISFIPCTFSIFQSSNHLSFIGAAVTRPRLDRFYLDQIDKVRAFPRRSFHELVTFSSLATWGLGPEPSAENLSHEETTRKSEYRPASYHFLFCFFFLPFFLTDFFRHRNTYNERKQRKNNS